MPRQVHPPAVPHQALPDTMTPVFALLGLEMVLVGPGLVLVGPEMVIVVPELVLVAPSGCALLPLARAVHDRGLRSLQAHPRHQPRGV